MGTRATTLENLAERFWAKTEVGSPDLCWEWTATRVQGGYGAFHLRDGLIPGAPPSAGGGGRMHPATRVAWYLSNSEWPALDRDVCHSCDNPPCVNPAHLWLGTTQENMNDRDRKGRGGGGQSGGMDHPQCRITDDQVREMVARAQAGESYSAISRDYGVCSSYVSMFARGLRRTDATGIRPDPVYSARYGR